MTQYFSPVPPYLNAARLGAWLTQQPSDNVVGMSGDANNCPIAHFINDMGEYTYVCVDDYSIVLVDDQDGHAVFRTPDMLASFIGEIDADDNRPVTAAEALDVLNNVVLDWNQ